MYESDISHGKKRKKIFNHQINLSAFVESASDLVWSWQVFAEICSNFLSWLHSCVCVLFSVWWTDRRHSHAVTQTQSLLIWKALNKCCEEKAIHTPAIPWLWNTSLHFLPSKPVTSWHCEHVVFRKVKKENISLAATASQLLWPAKGQMSQREKWLQLAPDFTFYI